ncbi:exopolysaccharide production repressor protein [Mesorhizobium argentiipisi]|uniref:Exopolysaccharide repressor protein n=1 Tax=Mesorhizobium argentiipisi TaxID=3015175 RepID=A0ABU8K8Q6_9HYPH
MSLRMLCVAMAVVLPINALAVYVMSLSICTVVIKTLSCALLLQAGYFASVLFLIWRSGCPGRVAQKAKHFDGHQEGWGQSPTFSGDGE